MDEGRKAQELSRYLDDLLQGKGSVSAAVVDEEIEALGELGRSLTQIKFQPRPAHRAAVERLLQKHRPTLQTGGATMSRMIWGIPRRWFFGLLAALIGGIVTIGGVVLVVIVIAVAIFFAPGVETPTPVLTLEVTTVLPPATTVPTETVTASPVASPTITLTPSLTVTITPTVTVVPSLTVTATPTPTATIVPTPTTTVTPTVTPTPTVTITPTEPAMSGLAFHPAHLNAGGKCREVYVASGSLKNHGTSSAANVEIGYEFVEGGEWVDRVEVTPSNWTQLGTDKPARFTVSVYVNDDWPAAGKGAEINVRLFVQNEESLSGEHSTEVIFVVRNQCKEEKPGKAEKSGKKSKKGE